MKYNSIDLKNWFFLLFFYLFAVILGFLILKDFGIHIEEKYHRLNGLFWLNYIFKILNFENLQVIVESKISDIYDYTLSSVEQYNKWGVIFDVPLAYLEILFQLENVYDIYYFKHFFSFLIFLIGSFFFFKILYLRYNNFLLSFTGLLLYLSSPRIFGDSFLYKDTLYLSIFSIVLYFFIKSIKEPSNKNLLLLSVSTALAFNLKIFTIILLPIFGILLIIQNFYIKTSKFFLWRFFFYCFFFFAFTYIFWPYLWSHPIKNFFELFTSIKIDLINVRILYFNDYVQNTLLPTSYLANWIFISSPFAQNILFIFGFLVCFTRLIKRFFKIKENMIFQDLWRGEKERIDVIFIFIFLSYLIFFIVLNAPFYNGWRLVYFFNFFIIFFGINFLHYILKIFRRKYILKKIFKLFFLIVVLNNFYLIISTHPFQSIYFNNFLSKKIVNGFEGDYYGLSAKHFYEKILEIDDKNLIKIAVACHTPIQRGLEALPSDSRKRFKIVGQEYNDADYIYKNNISEVNKRLNNKYEIPKNFSKIYEFKIKKLLVYNVYKKKY